MKHKNSEYLSVSNFNSQVIKKVYFEEKYDILN